MGIVKCSEALSVLCQPVYEMVCAAKWVCVDALQSKAQRMGQQAEDSWWVQCEAVVSKNVVNVVLRVMS